jgi:uncharacterized caspase-like protein
MTNRFSTIFMVLSILILLPRVVVAETRIALVIGNGVYEQAPLDNPSRDADLMAETLKSLGFQMVVKKDLDHREMRRVISTFGKRLKEANDAIGFFYYSGHGMQLNNRNYMISVDAEIKDDPDVESDGVPTDLILGEWNM